MSSKKSPGKALSKLEKEPSASDKSSEEVEDNESPETTQPSGKFVVIVPPVSKKVSKEVSKKVSSIGTEKKRRSLHTPLLSSTRKIVIGTPTGVN